MVRLLKNKYFLFHLVGSIVPQGCGADRELIEIYIKEKEKFDADPEKYKNELKKRGGEVIED